MAETAAPPANGKRAYSRKPKTLRGELRKLLNRWMDEILASDLNATQRQEASRYPRELSNILTDFDD